MTIEGRTLELEYSNGSTYLSADNLSVGVKSYGAEVLLKSTATNGYANFNDAAKAVLFPNSAAKPVKADSRIVCGASVSNKNNYCSLEFGGTEVHKVLCSVEIDEQDGLTNAAITGATSATAIRYRLHIANLFVAGACSKAKITLYFKRYTCSAMTTGSGVASATVSDAEPWGGDSVTFTATLVAGATFDGWYSDAACTQRVSTSLSYTTTAADLTLYAKATQAAPTGTGVYIRRAGAQVQAAEVWRKENGLWGKADKTAIDAGKNYRIIQR